MEITQAQYEQIERICPRQRGNVSLCNPQVLNSILYVAEHNCRWRGLPKRFSNWHTICTRMNGWSKLGVMDRAYEGNETRQLAFDLGFTPVVPPHPKRAYTAWHYSKAIYKRRNEIERLFRRLKGFRRIFSRFEKLDVMFTAFIHFALIADALR